MPEYITPNTGKVILDGTSYSGADIKAVVHVYSDSARAQQVQLLEDRVNFLVRENATNSISQGQRDINSKVIETLKQEIDQILNDRSAIVTKVLAEVQTISVSTYREKYPVRALSTTYPKGFTRGPRTVAGSMVFTVFDKNVLYELLTADMSEFDSDKVFSSALIDQLPPFDITLSFANELGQQSRMTILACEFVSEGQTMSIHDLFIENTVQYVARDIDPMVKTGDKRLKVLTPGTKSASDLGREIKAQEYKYESDPFERFKTRNNPFE